MDDGLTITELAGVLHLDGYLRKLLQRIHGNQACMPRSTARRDDDTLGVEETLLIVNKARESDIVMLHIDTPTHGVGQRTGLLEYLLEHEVRIAAFLQLREGELQPLNLRRLADIAYRSNIQFLAPLNRHDLFVFDIDDLIGIFDYRRSVRSEEILVFADTHHERTTLTGSDNDIGVRAVENGNGVRTHHLVECELNCRLEVYIVRLLGILDELHQHLGIGRGLEGIAVLLQALLKHRIVLDNTVMDNRQLLRLGVVRVRIHRIRLAVGSPTGMRNTNRSPHILITCKCFQLGNFAFCLIHIKFTFGVDKGNTGTIITTILQTVKSFNQNWIRLSFTNITYNATHILEISLFIQLSICRYSIKAVIA